MGMGMGMVRPRPRERVARPSRRGGARAAGLRRARALGLLGAVWCWWKRAWAWGCSPSRCGPVTMRPSCRRGLSADGARCMLSHLHAATHGAFTGWGAIRCREQRLRTSAADAQGASRGALGSLFRPARLDLTSHDRDAIGLGDSPPALRASIPGAAWRLRTSPISRHAPDGPCRPPVPTSKRSPAGAP